jgi:hypothetical protein
MKQRNRFPVIARHLQGAAALALRRGFCGKGLAHITSQEEVDMLLGRGRVWTWPLGAIEAIQGAQEACGRMGGRGTPGRADGWQPLGQLGQEPGHDGWSRAVLGFALEPGPAALHGALRGGPQERLAFVGPAPAGVATGPLWAPSSKGGA